MPQGFTLAWRGKQYRELVRREMADRLDVAAKYHRDYIVADISRQCDFVHHSTPPDSPFRETGDLMKSFKAKVDRRNLVAYVYTTSDHALPLEFGWFSQQANRRIQPRPFQRRAFTHNLPDFQGVITSPL